MYQIFADDTLIYDSTFEDYKIGKGSISLEADKNGSFSFSVYPEHFYYDSFVKMRTVVKVLKFGKIIFRGRILNDVTDYWNNKVITCEGELGFLQDSTVRPFDFSGTPENLFKKYINDHNAQVKDDFKKFKVGKITVTDPNGYIARNSTVYQTTLDSMTERLTGSDLGGHFYITHGENGAEDIPTLNYLADFNKVSTQIIEFGENLKNYTKTVKAEDIATAIIPLGATIETESDTEEENPKLTIASVNNGLDYIYSPKAVELYGWIFKVVEWQDVTIAENLKRKAEEYLEIAVNQNTTIELNAIDLHILDRNIESFNVCDYVRVMSTPHNIDMTLLCTKQIIDLLKPENDSLVLGQTFLTLANAMDNKTSKTAISKSGNVTTIVITDKNGTNTTTIKDGFSPKVSVEKIEGGNRVIITDINGPQYIDIMDGAGIDFETDETLSFKNGVLSVNTATDVESDNTLPITSAAVAETVGNIEILLKTI